MREIVKGDLRDAATKLRLLMATDGKAGKVKVQPDHSLGMWEIICDPEQDLVRLGAMAWLDLKVHCGEFFEKGGGDGPTEEAADAGGGAGEGAN
jgi:hypothetical protein